jgi:DNA-binding beta-propeller fold protein YncE
MVVHGLGLLAERALNVTPPGIVIDQSSDWENIYLGSPSIAVLPDGTYVASHDYFGPGTSYDTCAVFRSTDRGATWTRASILTGQFWSLLFVCQDKLHIIGSTARWSSLVVRRSDDGGFTWTDPVDADNGLIVVQDNDFLYGIAPGAMLVHDGRLWKSAVRRDNGPRGLAISPDNLLYVGDRDNHRILKFDPADGSFEGVFVKNSPDATLRPQFLAWYNNTLYATACSGSPLVSGIHARNPSPPMLHGDSFSATWKSARANGLSLLAPC